MAHELNWMTRRPIAHRGFHDANNSIYENTLSSCKEAIDRGFNIEIDLHPSQDLIPVVFHDPTLERLCGDKRKVRKLHAKDMREIKIGNSADHIATLDELLNLVDGKVGIVMELKGILGEDDGFVEGVANSLKNYGGQVAVMSFFHWLLKDARKLGIKNPLGLTAMDGDNMYSSHKSIMSECQLDFVSYRYKDLSCKFVREVRKSRLPTICWTVKSPQDMRQSLQYCDQITFEGFNPDQL